MVKLQVLGNNSKTVNNISNLTWGKNDQHSTIYLPCNFEVNPITHFDRLCKLEKGGRKFKKKSSPLKLLSQFQPNFSEMILRWSPFKNCVRQHRPVSKMATITKNRNFFKWPKLLYFKPESAQI